MGGIVIPTTKTAAESKQQGTREEQRGAEPWSLGYVILTYLPGTKELLLDFRESLALEQFSTFPRTAKPATKHCIPGVIELLVGFVSAVGVANLALQVALFCLVEVKKARPVSPLSVSVNVHLDDTVLDSGFNVGLLKFG